MGQTERFTSPTALSGLWTIRVMEVLGEAVPLGDLRWLLNKNDKMEKKADW